MLDYGVFYEFIPMDEFNGLDSQNVIPLSEVVLGKNYAIVITTNSGLWRYVIGDTVRFTSSEPYRFKITGRTKSFINTFGEELIVENAEMAIAQACLKTGAQIKEYTACPIYMEEGHKGAHEWLVEFRQLPSEMERFILILDEELRALNSDYDAKRHHDLVLEKPKLVVLKKGTFDIWLKNQGKLGGQNKIPRLANDRVIVEQILLINN